MTNEAWIESAAIHLRDSEEEVPVLSLSFAKGSLRLHGQRFLIGDALTARGADLHANLTASAVFRRHLDRVRLPRPVLMHGLQRLERRRRALYQVFVVRLD